MNVGDNLKAEFPTNFEISTPAKPIPPRPNSHVDGAYETNVIPKAEGSDQESVITRIESDSPPQCK